MSRIRKVFTVGATFGAAMGIGFVIQNGDALAARLNGTPTTPAAMITSLAPDVVPVKAEIDLTDLANGPVMTAPALVVAGYDGLVLPEAVAGPDLPAAPVRLATIESELPAGDLLPAQTEPGTECEIGLAATPAPAAMIAVSVIAPCAPSTEFIVHHQGMMFSEVTDETGLVNFVMPGLAQLAVIMVEFPNGQAGVTTSEVPDFNSYDRAVLLWQGVRGLQVHAREFGADYGDEGHVWYGAPRTPTTTLGGFLVRLGDEAPTMPYMADIYTYPSGTSARDGSILLTVEAEITPDNCGQDVTAQSLQFHPGADATASDLTMRMPDCSAAGDFLVLKNMFSDLTIASN